VKNTVLIYYLQITKETTVAKPLQPFNLDPLFIKPNELRILQQVKVPDIFEGSSENFHEEGLFSTTIFGNVGTELRDNSFGYIDIKLPILHPFMLKVVTQLRGFYKDLIGGKVYATWDDKEKDFVASNQIDGDTGFYFFLNHWKDIKFKRTSSRLRDEKIAYYEKIPQIGIVELEDNVEVGANTCIDRATMGHTLIKQGVKLDNLIQVAHNVEIGKHTVMASQVGIAGSAKIGEWCMFGGQVGVAGHIKVGDHVNVGAQSGIPGNTKSNTTLMGYPAIDPKQFARSAAIYKKLPDMYVELGRLQKEIEELKKQLNK
jgi:carbonic anhydrase/acetyltransferase-like protein (isoleucine patch superfamily)